VKKQTAFRLEQDEFEWLRKRAYELRCSQNAIIEKLIRSEIEKEKEKERQE